MSEKSARIHAWNSPATETSAKAVAKYSVEGSESVLRYSKYSVSSQEELVEDWSQRRRADIELNAKRSGVLKTPREMKATDDVFNFTVGDLDDSSKYTMAKGLPLYPPHTGYLDAIARRDNETQSHRRCAHARQIYAFLLKLIVVILLNCAFVYCFVTWGFQLRRHVAHTDGQYWKFRSFFSKQPDITLGKLLSLSGSRGEMVWRGQLKVRESFEAAWVTAAGITQTSDSRLKKDIRSIGTDQNLLYGLKGVTFKWRDPLDKEGFQTSELARSVNANDGDHYGFIAQEVQGVFPELVHADTDGKLSVEYSAMVPIVVEVLKTQKNEIDVMKRTISTLQHEMKLLQNSLYGRRKNPDVQNRTKVTSSNTHVRLK